MLATLFPKKKPILTKTQILDINPDAADLLFSVRNMSDVSKICIEVLARKDKEVSPAFFVEQAHSSTMQCALAFLIFSHIFCFPARYIVEQEEKQQILNISERNWNGISIFTRMKILFFSFHSPFPFSCPFPLYHFFFVLFLLNISQKERFPPLLYSFIYIHS